MKIPVICGIALKEKDDVIEALALHNGGDHTATYGVCLFDDYAPAVAGFSEKNEVIYDYEKMVQLLMERDGMTREDAEGFINFNTIPTLTYMKNPPVILYPADEYEEED